MVTRDLSGAPAGRLRTALVLSFGGLPRTFWIVIGGTIANRIGSMVVPFLVFFLGSKGVSATSTGTIMVALGLGSMVGAAVGGWLADRIGPRPAVVVIGVASTGLAHTPWQYATTTVVWSVGEVVGGIVYGGIAVDLAPTGAQGRYQDAMNRMSSMARLAGPAVTTGLFTATGPAGLWWGSAVSGVLGALVLLRMTPALRRRTGQA
jgi:MFS family permease